MRGYPRSRISRDLVRVLQRGALTRRAGGAV